ncbi:RNA polymerase I-specific transcription initiation factor RRN3 [Acrodontium crateriforme]|uniref:RNA polymerase I-specific transcription initiation factor RRN3 n=1 Tax=Acrodontium crateriforme TaxID=150365 RepID=A0AAQ3R4L7_9PEZI|nr:RNA polymerase I-specific transcription initiation factor RRN3 [Acrodontium crateriforme]
MVSLASPAGAMMPPPLPTPLSRRPPYALKRDSSYLGSDDSNAPPSPTKRLKVAFSPNVDVRIVDDWNEKSFDLVKEEVRIAIDRHRAAGDEHDDTPYAKLLQFLGQDARSDEAPTAKLLMKYLVALDARVSSLAQCSKVIAAVLDLSWLGRDENFVRIYLKLLCSIATAHARYLPSILDSLVSHLASLSPSLGRLPGEAAISKTNMISRVHMTIRTILRQIPSATGVLSKSIRLLFPNDLENTRSYLQYQKHLLQLAEYTPELKADIMALITQRLVSIDVQIQQDLEDVDEEVEEKLFQPGMKAHPDHAEDFVDSDDESVSESELTMTDDEQRLRDLRLQVSKMDGTLDLLFDYYTPLIQDGRVPEQNEAYQQLLSHFTTFIMPNRTRHAQFLLFHFAQSSTTHTMLFAKQCLEIVMEHGSAANRLNACAFLSSFVARGAHLQSDVVQDIFSVLCEFLDDMRQRYEPTCRGPNRLSYSLYYAVAQAILYIFCFRWRDLAMGSASPELGDEELSEDDLLADGRELAWYPGVKEILRRNIYSALNPLKVCSPAIVAEFAKIANHLRFIYVFPLLETNKRLRLGQIAAFYTGSLPDIGRRETAWDRKTGETHLQLEAYFPFDPYHLPTSRHWVESDYNEWKLPSGMRRDDEDEEYSEDEDDESDDGSLLDEVENMPVAADMISQSS